MPDLYIHRPLTHADRCDVRVCGAQALVCYVFYTEDADAISDLVFCGHHATHNEDNLFSQGFCLIEDKR